MDGRRVVAGLLISVVVLAVGIWYAGHLVVEAADRQAIEAGVPRLTLEEAAIRAAREDRFGLPSRLENPPPRDIEAHRRVGTTVSPLSVDPTGAAELVAAYAVSVELCAKRAKTGVSGAVQLTLDVSERHVSAVHATDREGAAWSAFEHCLVGGLRPAWFVEAAAAALPVTVDFP
ncbi:MAG: hypothetical protein ACI8PZ_000417 [Myxococcota bacterium]